MTSTFKNTSRKATHMVGSCIDVLSLKEMQHSLQTRLVKECAQCSQSVAYMNMKDPEPVHFAIRRFSQQPESCNSLL